jgi:hypothetical protein
VQLSISYESLYIFALKINPTRSLIGDSQCESIHKRLYGLHTQWWDAEESTGIQGIVCKLYTGCKKILLLRRETLYNIPSINFQITVSDSSNWNMVIKKHKTYNTFRVSKCRTVWCIIPCCSLNINRRFGTLSKSNNKSISKPAWSREQAEFGWFVNPEDGVDMLLWNLQIIFNPLDGVLVLPFEKSPKIKLK